MPFEKAKPKAKPKPDVEVRVVGRVYVKDGVRHRTGSTFTVTAAEFKKAGDVLEKA